MTLDISTSLLLVRITGYGGNGTGPISLPGVLVGDVLVKVSSNGCIESFECVAANEGEIQQTTTVDWSSLPLTFYFLRGTFS